MFEDPRQFIQEKLSKKFLSINTIRDGVMAAFLITLEKQAEQEGEVTDTVFRRDTAREIRKTASAAFSEINAPFEYPSLEQLQKVTEGIKRAYAWESFQDQFKAEFEVLLESLFEKWDDAA